MTAAYIVVVVVVIYVMYTYIFSDRSTLSSSAKDATSQTITAANSLQTDTDSGNANGSNFCYSVWLYVNDWNYMYGDTKTVLSRSTDSFENPAPMIVLDKYQNNVTTVMTVYPPSHTESTAESSRKSTNKSDDAMEHRCTIPNVPIQTWFNVTVSVMNRTMDMYLNGKLVRTCVLPGVPKVNASWPLYLTPKGGFSGKTAKLQYWPSACSPQKAWDIYESGYGSGLAGLFESMKVKLSFIDNNVEKGSVTI